MKVIFIAGAWGSGTSAVAGALDKMGITSLPPHFHTNDPRTPNSFESLAFRKLVYSFANESTLTKNMACSAKFIQGMKILMQQAKANSADAVVLKMPLASICTAQIIEAVDPYIIVVHRPLENIEASRIRRGWPSHLGAQTAQIIYSTLSNDSRVQI